ncbi:hypothetical protein F5146DRAFT_963412 [Armillaria mellea]|nr:hypothetical protein F5146DRAFT_963412 [Armillaria mellea]
MSSSCEQCSYNGQDHLPLSFEAADLSAPRMDELLKSNVPPLPAEQVQLDSAIGKGVGYLAGLQERIARARASLELLLDEERHVERTIESYRAIVRPILRVPEDAVREVFLTCWATDLKEEGMDTLSGQFAPLILSQVCRDWRRIALSTSRLWSSITLDFDLYDNELPCQYLLQSYLLRSGMHDITLSIYSTTDIWDSHLIPVLLLSAPRWTNLSISIPYKSLHAFSAFRGSLHRLKRLSIEFIDDDIPDLPDGLAKPIFDAFEYAPLLRSVSIEGVPASTKVISLPWSQLTEYFGCDWTTSYIDVLKRAPAMERISVECDEDSEFDGAVSPSSHQRLRILFVREVEMGIDADIVPGGIIHFLSQMEFPALKVLTMVYLHPFVRFPASLRGSTAHSLDNLTIHTSFTMSPDAQADLLALLKTTSSLSAFRLTYHPVPTLFEIDGIFLGLNANTNPNILPKLKRLGFRLPDEVMNVSATFVDMVESRRPGQAASTRTLLQTLCLCAPAIITPVDPDVDARWRDLCDEGFILRRVRQ